MSSSTKLKSQRAAREKLKYLETFAAPREFLSATNVLSRLANRTFGKVVCESKSYQILKKSCLLSPLSLEQKKLYSRLYSSPNSKRDRLMIGFTGRAQRMLMPLPIFIQALPANTDLLILSDPNYSHYRQAIWDGHRTFTDLPDAVKPITNLYRDVIAVGTSSGGFPAIRFAKLAGLRRAISFGGRTIDDSVRLTRGIDSGSAYDVLCSCDPYIGTEAIFCYSEDHKEDARSASQSACCANSHLLPLALRDSHNALWIIATMGHLPDFLTLAFTGHVNDLIHQITEWNAASLKKEHYKLGFAT